MKFQKKTNVLMGQGFTFNGVFSVIQIQFKPNKNACIYCYFNCNYTSFRDISADEHFFQMNF